MISIIHISIVLARSDLIKVFIWLHRFIAFSCTFKFDQIRPTIHFRHGLYGSSRTLPFIVPETLFAIVYKGISTWSFGLLLLNKGKQTVMEIFFRFSVFSCSTWAGYINSSVHKALLSLRHNSRQIFIKICLFPTIHDMEINRNLTACYISFLFVYANTMHKLHSLHRINNLGLRRKGKVVYGKWFAGKQVVTVV